jgi:predicted dehydrogenase
MKAYDPAVLEAARTVRDPSAGLGELRAIEVAVLHPTSASQLAFAHLLPPPTDVDRGMIDVLRGVSAALIRDAIGAEAAGDVEIAGLYAEILLGSLVHELSVIRAVVGDLVAVDAVDAWGATGSDPGSVLLAGRMANGARATIGWHFLPHYPAYREDVRFHFVGGSVELSFAAPYRLHEPTSLIVSTGGDETRRRVILDSIVEGFEEELLAFANVVRNGTAPRTTIAEGRADIVTCQLAIARFAARRGIAIGGEAAVTAREHTSDEGRRES